MTRASFPPAVAKPAGRRSPQGTAPADDIARPGIPAPGASPGRREAWACAVVLLLLAAAVFGSHVLHGGFYWADDWFRARLWRFPVSDSILWNVDQYGLRFRPVLSIASSTPFKLFALNTKAHLALTAALGVAASTSFFWLLRTLGLARWHAGAVAALSLLFPWSDSTRLWTGAAMLNLSPMLSFLGMAFVVRAVRARGARFAGLLAGGLALFVLAILTYEAVAVAIALSGVLYVREARRRGAVAWALSALTAGAAAAWVVSRLPPRYDVKPSLGAQLDHAGVIAAHAWDIARAAVVPAGGAPGAVATVLIAAVALGALVRLWLARRAGRREPEIARWLRIAALAVLLIGAAYAPFARADPLYVPAAGGVANRINLLAAFGFALLAYSVVVLAVALLPARVRLHSGRAWLAAGAVGAIAAGYIVHLDRDKHNWDRAAALQRRTLAVIARHLPLDTAGSTVYAFRTRNYTAPGVPVFALSTDLGNALQATLARRGLRAIALRGRAGRPGQFTRWVCLKDRLYPRDYFLGSWTGTTYGRAIFVDVANSQSAVIRNQADCRRYSRRFGHPPLP